MAYRLYKATFDREPDSAGLSYWNNALQGGASITVVAAAFAGSSEFQTKYGPLANQQFVEQLYQNVLGRAGEGSGVSFWTNALNQGASRGEILAGFSESTENKEITRPSIEAGLWDLDDGMALVARLYHATFDRRPDAGGLRYWDESLDGGTSLTTIAASFASSTEFQATYGTLNNRGFVEQIYQNVLDRAGEASGVDYWTGRLNAGVSRGEVLLGFSESAEHKVKVAAFIDDGIWLA